MTENKIKMSEDELLKLTKDYCQTEYPRYKWNVKLDHVGSQSGISLPDYCFYMYLDCGKVKSIICGAFCIVNIKKTWEDLLQCYILSLIAESISQRIYWEEEFKSND
jgi:hypothetical protein